MNDARRYAVWPEPRSRSRSLKGSRPSVPHGTNFYFSLFGKYSAHPLSPRIQRRTQGRVSPGEGSMGPGMLFFQEAYEVPPLTLCALRRRVVREHQTHKPAAGLYLWLLSAKPKTRRPTSKFTAKITCGFDIIIICNVCNFCCKFTIRTFTAQLKSSHKSCQAADGLKIRLGGSICMAETRRAYTLLIITDFFRKFQRVIGSMAYQQAYRPTYHCQRN